MSYQLVTPFQNGRRCRTCLCSVYTRTPVDWIRWSLFARRWLIYPAGVIYFYCFQMAAVFMTSLKYLLRRFSFSIIRYLLPWRLCLYNKYKFMLKKTLFCCFWSVGRHNIFFFCLRSYFCPLYIWSKHFTTVLPNSLFESKAGAKTFKIIQLFVGQV